MISPDTIYFHVTKDCNLNCNYCYFSAGKPMQTELSSEEAISVIESACLIKPRRIVFTGGEPLLRKDIFDLSQKIKLDGYNIQKCITTNGTLINKQSAKRLVDNFDEIRISIDGFKQVNDSMRGKGTFDRIMESFYNVLHAGGNPIAFITVSSINLPELKSFMQFLLSKGIVRIHVSLMKIIGRAKDPKLFCNIEEVRMLVKDFWYESFGISLEIEHKETNNCGLGKYLTVNPDGLVYPCHALVYQEFCIGNIRKNSLESIYNNSLFMDKLRNLKYYEINSCIGCFNRDNIDNNCLGAQILEYKNRKKIVGLINSNNTN